VQLPRFKSIYLFLLFEQCLFRPNWLLSSGVQVVEETAATLSTCNTLQFKCVKYLQNILKLFLKHNVVIILLYARAVGLGVSVIYNYVYQYFIRV
jgi:hypothetical protein